MKVLILGAGYTGSRLARWLETQNIEVNLTTRTGIPPAEIQSTCFSFCWDSAGEKVPLSPQALQGVTHVLSTIPPDSQGLDPVIQSLLPALESLELQWFGYLSTTGVYGDTSGQWVDETAVVQPQNPRSRHRVVAENSYLAANLASHIFRLPGIYGPGRSTFERLEQGNAQRIDRPGHVFSRVHVDDIVQALWQSMLQPTPGEIYNICDDCPCEPSQLIGEACDLLGVEPPPWVALNAVDLSPMAASFWSECRRVENHKIKSKLGINLLYPSYREGLRAIWQQDYAD
jgi:nucleoside-diphosphate-sugar epimerase